MGESLGTSPLSIREPIKDLCEKAISTSALNELRVFKRQLLQVVSDSQLRWPNVEIWANTASQDWIFYNVFDTETSNFTPSIRYRLRILKKILVAVESVNDPEEDTISDHLTSALSSLLSQPIPSEAAMIQMREYVTYSFPSIDFSAGVTVLESRSVISSSGTTGLRTWEAAIHLSSFLTSQSGSTFIKSKRVLELGAGTGLVSILCAKYLRPDFVRCTDGNEGVVEAVGENIFLNGLAEIASIDSRPLLWGRAIPDHDETRVFDTILGADITYDETIFPSLLYTFTHLCQDNANAQILIAATIRNAKTFETFLNSCAKAGFSADEIHFNTLAEEYQTGPFYSSVTPIRILLLRSDGLEKRDLFSF